MKERVWLQVSSHCLFVLQLSRVQTSAEFSFFHSNNSDVTVGRAGPGRAAAQNKHGHRRAVLDLPGVLHLSCSRYNTNTSPTTAESREVTCGQRARHKLSVCLWIHRIFCCPIRRKDTLQVTIATGRMGCFSPTWTPE